MMGSLLGCMLLLGQMAVAARPPASRVRGQVTQLKSVTPFEDTQGRFSLDLPAGWSFAPQPGDASGVYFRRVWEGMPANATVRFMTFTVPIDLNAFAARIAAASDQEPGFRLLQSEPVLVAGTTAIGRRFVTFVGGNKRLTKVVEQRLGMLGPFKAYVLHAETLADVFGTFEKDFETLFSSFVPHDSAKPIGPTRAKRPRRFDRRLLVGLWEGGGQTLQLSPAGVAVLGEQSGSYRVDQGVLVLHFGDTEQVFNFELTGKTLQLSGGSFGAGQAFVRRSPARAKP
jgi:hypothetical protein